MPRHAHTAAQHITTQDTAPETWQRLRAGWRSSSVRIRGRDGKTQHARTMRQRKIPRNKKSSHKN